MELLFFRGTGLINSLVRWQTNAPYAHVAYKPHGSDKIIEALPKYGVRVRELNSKDRFDCYTFRDVAVIVNGQSIVFDEQKAREYAVAQVGKKYDYQGVLRFVTREKATHPEKWFCSELCYAIIREGLKGIRLLNLDEAWRVSPGTLALSPLLQRTYEP